MASEDVAAESWALNTLATDGILSGVLSGRWYPDVAPGKDPDTGLPPEYPFGIISLHATTDGMAMGRERIWAKPLLFVRVIGQDGGYGEVVPLADRADAILHKAASASVTIGDTEYKIQDSHRERSFHHSWAEDGVQYFMAGGFYRMLSSAVPE